MREHDEVRDSQGCNTRGKIHTPVISFKSDHHWKDSWIKYE